MRGVEISDQVYFLEDDTTYESIEEAAYYFLDRQEEALTADNFEKMAEKFAAELTIGYQIVVEADQGWMLGQIERFCELPDELEISSETLECMKKLNESMRNDLAGFFWDSGRAIKISEASDALEASLREHEDYLKKAYEDYMRESYEDFDNRMKHEEEPEKVPRI